MRIDAWRRLAPVLGVALFGAGWLAAPANAQEGGERVVLRAVDASDNENVRAVVGYSGDPSDLDGLEVRVNGDSVDATVADLAEAGMASNVVFVFDTSAGVEGNGLLAAAQDAISDIVETLPPGVEVGVVSAGGGSQIVQRMTTDSNEILDAIDDLNPAGDGAVLSGVIQGSALAGDAGAVPTVVLVTDGVEEPGTTFERAEGSLLAEGAALYVVGLQDGGLDEAAFADLASRTGGRMVTTADAGEVGGLIDDVSPEAMSLRAALFASGQTEGVQDLAVAVDDASTTGSYVSGSSRIGFNRLLPIESVEGGGIAFFQSGIGRLLGFAAAALACVLFAYGVMLLFVRDQTTLSQALRPYADGYVAEPSEDDDGNQHLAQTALLQRAVAFTEQMAERRDLLTRLENSLERADLPLRAGEALFFYMAGVALVLLALLALTQNFMAMLVVGLIVALLPPGILNFLAARKKKQFEGLLPDTLQLLSSTLRAGYSMMQGVEAVSQEVAEPMGKELRRVVTEARLGRPLEESLDAVAERMGSKDFAWAVMAIRIQREVGGNLSELLLTVAETMTQRERLRRDVNSLTAEGRISAYVLIALPVGLGMFLYSVNPDYIGKLFDETLGQIMLGGAVIMVVVGYLWMMKIIKIEI